MEYHAGTIYCYIIMCACVGGKLKTKLPVEQLLRDHLKPNQKTKGFSRTEGPLAKDIAI